MVLKELVTGTNGDIQTLLESISICHGVKPTTSNTYQASSPDEVALITAIAE
jgi:magnesium-transporting ATPase (P-type)